jgi:hypothetical protein
MPRTFFFFPLLVDVVLLSKKFIECEDIWTVAVGILDPTTEPKQKRKVFTFTIFGKA